MLKPPLLLAVLVLFVSIATFPETSRAAEVTCPVCKEVFGDSVEICPHDGTNLKLVGKARSDSADEEGARDSVEKQDGPKEQRSTKKHKYRRTDRGKRRVRKKPGEGSGYSDRRSRITDRRGYPLNAEAQKQRQKEQELFLQKDRDLMSEYERERAAAWEDRQRLLQGENQARVSREQARRALLHGLAAPLTSFGFRLFWLPEGRDAGLVNTAEIDINLARYKLRVGLSTLIGVRLLSERNEIVFLEHLSAGFQWPWRFSPYVVARGGVGVLAGERFGEEIVNVITTVGVESGIDSWITPWVSIAPSFGYMRCMVTNAYWDTFTFKLSVGF